jgi:hypothetical protein
MVREIGGPCEACAHAPSQETYERSTLPHLTGPTSGPRPKHQRKRICQICPDAGRHTVSCHDPEKCELNPERTRALASKRIAEQGNRAQLDIISVSWAKGRELHCGARYLNNISLNLRQGGLSAHTKCRGGGGCGGVDGGQVQAAGAEVGVIACGRVSIQRGVLPVRVTASDSSLIVPLSR